MSELSSQALDPPFIRAFKKTTIASKPQQCMYTARQTLERKKLLTSLPTELLLEIAEQYLPGIKDICSLVLTNRRFSQLFAQILIRRAAHERTSSRSPKTENICQPRPFIIKRRSVLHWAAAHGDYNLLEKLLDEEYTKRPIPIGRRSTVPVPMVTKRDLVNDLDWFGMSPLASAVLNKHTDIVKLLIKNGADPNWKAEFYTLSMIHAATFLGLHEILDCLLAAGANPNVFDIIAYGTPLHLAVALNDLPSIRSLCQAGAKPYYGCLRLSPMNLACQLNLPEAKQVLIDSRVAAEVERNGFYCPMNPAHLKRIQECTIENIKNDLQWKYREDNDGCCRCRRLDPRFGVNRWLRTST